MTSQPTQLTWVHAQTKTGIRICEPSAVAFLYVRSQVKLNFVTVAAEFWRSSTVD